ncbi:hypothetical protein DY000_02007404 [Brassica cretica]|uniref:Uncharacterized protein n=1 Tax=Brassica cretica TaxID=69181 RepID=A0ABQ7C6D9_BRACR|nr:hypothetical protein DY000_02007404 [Brassica cretica]
MRLHHSKGFRKILPPPSLDSTEKTTPTADVKGEETLKESDTESKRKELKQTNKRNQTEKAKEVVETSPVVEEPKEKQPEVTAKEVTEKQKNSNSIMSKRPCGFLKSNLRQKEPVSIWNLNETKNYLAVTKKVTGCVFKTWNSSTPGNPISYSGFPYYIIHRKKDKNHHKETNTKEIQVSPPLIHAVASSSPAISDTTPLLLLSSPLLPLPISERRPCLFRPSRLLLSLPAPNSISSPFSLLLLVSLL